MTLNQAREILLRGGAEHAIAGRIAGRVAAVASHLETTQGAPVAGDLFWAIAVAETHKVCRRDERASAAAARAARIGKRLAG